MSLEFPDTFQSDEGTTAFLRKILSGVSLLSRDYRVCFTRHDRTFVAKPDGFIIDGCGSELLLIDAREGNKSKGKGMTINELLRILNGEIEYKYTLGNGPAFCRLYKDDAVPVSIDSWEEGAEEPDYYYLTGDGYEMLPEQKEIYFFVS